LDLAKTTAMITDCSCNNTRLLIYVL